jgi:hypothetical protein
MDINKHLEEHWLGYLIVAIIIIATISPLFSQSEYSGSGMSVDEANGVMQDYGAFGGY